MDSAVNSGGMEPKEPANGIDVIQLLLTLWVHRKWIIACMVVFTALGVVMALLKPRVYHASAIIALKEEDKGNSASRVLAQFGGLGGSVASQLGIGGTSLDRIEVILNGHELAEAIIKRNNLMPALFPKLWDRERGTWKSSDPEKIPRLRHGVRVLRGSIHTSVDIKKRMLSLTMGAYSPTLAKQLVDYYLNELNEKLRQDVVRDAEANQRYLETQLDNTIDPILQEKIHGLVAYEIEKKMLVSSSSFVLLEGPVVPVSSTSPNKRKIVVMFLLLGLLFSSGVVFALKGLARLRATFAKESAAMRKLS
jgi:uncharacterized protein involved in exopolysaccharide biosynthesis